MRTTAETTQIAMMTVKAMVVSSQLRNTQREFPLLVGVGDGEVVVVSKGEALVGEIDVGVSTSRSRILMYAGMIVGIRGMMSLKII